jgi:prephenate dehydrogenase
MPLSKDSSSSEGANNEGGILPRRLEEIKQREQVLTRLLEAVREEKREALRSRPLTIGIIGFGRFGQFMARTFVKHGRVVVSSRTDYSDIAEGMGVTYIPLSDPAAFLNENLDVVIMATSIVSFKDTVATFAKDLRDFMMTLKDEEGKAADLPEEMQPHTRRRLPLIVDVLSVKEHPREIMLDVLPEDCDILCTHPMFGPDSGKYSWQGLNFVFERTRIHGILSHQTDDSLLAKKLSLEYIERLDRLERFLSIWEEEGCRMVELSCKEHDAYAANSQFLTHLMGRILGEQGLQSTPIDTKGFESVLKLVGTTTADSFDLFYGLYKYNQNSLDTIIKLKSSMDDVVRKLKEMENVDS